MKYQVNPNSFCTYAQALMGDTYRANIRNIAFVYNQEGQFIGFQFLIKNLIQKNNQHFLKFLIEF